MATTQTPSRSGYRQLRLLGLVMLLVVLVAWWAGSCLSDDGLDGVPVGTTDPVTPTTAAPAPEFDARDARNAPETIPMDPDATEPAGEGGLAG